MATSIHMSTRGRITIPKAVRENLGWTAGTKVEWIKHPDGRIEAKPAPPSETGA
ncbi:AbrB/MazE/SpoVT family DNA-binding domain-containing protein [Sphingomonas sp.]|uniref:AbrB/MazE/SpoVT family DNA-binding domain-containing protein n=1 Tax=Sphingomonas sp. TaxID=28214 RepID=UPI0035664C30